jgi:D-glycero-D-manno-heptose 1,7-bisphosphate phosphatase
MNQKSAHFDCPFQGCSSYILRLNLNRAVFLDRDGTLVQEMEYLSRPDQVVLLPGVGRALRGLHEAGFKLFIVSNQSGVGRGFFTLADVDRVHARLADQLAAEGVRFDKIYVAPEAPGAPGRGRKPLPQFLFDARDEFQLDLTQSYFIGDKLSDLQCGWNAGVKRSILVRTGYGRELEGKDDGGLAAAIIVDDLAAAAAWILQTEAADKTVPTR